MRKSRVLGLAAAALAAGLVLPAAPANAAAGAVAFGPASTYFPVSNYRILDTRVGNGAPAAPLGADSEIKLNVAQRLGIGTAPTAVVINITAVGPTQDSYAAVYPDGAPRPTVSNLNFNAGARNVVTNRVTVQVGADGYINLYNHVGQADFVVDIEGFYAAKGTNAGLAGRTFRVGTPTRLLDTRTDIGHRYGGVGPDTTLLADVSSVTDPSVGDTDLVLQLTSTNASDPSYVTAYANGVQRPGTSDLNLTPGEDITNLTLIDVGRDGLNLYNHAGWTDLVLDYVGTFDPHLNGDAGNSGLFTPSSPVRLLDTRVGIGAAAQQVGGGGTVRLKVTGVSGAPANVAAVVLNLTATNASGPSHLTAYASGTAKPGTSNLNFVPGKDIGSMVIVPVSADGYIDIANNAGNVDLVADLQGYFSR